MAEGRLCAVFTVRGMAMYGSDYGSWMHGSGMFGGGRHDFDVADSCRVGSCARCVFDQTIRTGLRRENHPRHPQGTLCPGRDRERRVQPKEARYWQLVNLFERTPSSAVYF